MINAWIEKTFTNKLSDKDILNTISEMLASKESEELASSPEFHFELSKVNSEAAFILWQLQKTKRLSTWIQSKKTPVDVIDTQVITTNLFPVLEGHKIIFLKDGKAYTQPSLKHVPKPMAFRKLEWQEVGSVSKVLLSYSEIELERVLKNEILFIAAIIAGAKFKSYQLARAYAEKRIQGGRAIKDWSSVQNLLSELHLSIKVDEVLVKNLNTDTAYALLKTADEFVSQNMQVLGGAGYTEDYGVERLYRECIFLKNWPRPFKQELIHHYQASTK